jgi:hypothetical protein
MLISARLALRGKPSDCLLLAKQGVIKTVTCAEILNEFKTKLVTKFHYDPQLAQDSADEVERRM